MRLSQAFTATNLGSYDGRNIVFLSLKLMLPQALS